MFSVNSLFKNDFFNGAKDFHPGRHHGVGHHGGQKSEAASPVSVSSTRIQQTLVSAYEKLQYRVVDRLPAADASQPTPTYAQNDFSPEAVADRVLGFVKDRLEQEKANGASDERLQDLYQQALSGIESGLKEAKQIIQANGLFSGEVEDNFNATVNKLADGLEALGNALFDDQEAAAPAGVIAQNQSLAFERSRSFEMEVTTQDGDVVKLVVNSGQSGYANQSYFQGDGVEVSGFEAGYSQFDNLSFSVEGDLDEGELAALQDLFSQVNSVAETFYGGDVEAAFNQAMDVGMDSEELAAFAVDLKQSHTMVAQSTYAQVGQMGNAASPYGKDVMPRLGDFAQRTREAADATQALPESSIDQSALLRELVSRLHSETDQPSDHGDAFRQFVAALA